MAAIYQADVWCDDCADSIADRIWAKSEEGATFSLRTDWEESVGYDDERNYDSDEYPKWCDDDEECDSPQHCAAGADCINAEVIDDVIKVGYFFGNSLTTDGADYLRETVREDVECGCVDSVACTLWMPYYDWVDFGAVATCDGCDTLAVCDSEGFCADCNDNTADPVSKWGCPVCGEYYMVSDSEIAVIGIPYCGRCADKRGIDDQEMELV